GHSYAAEPAVARRPRAGHLVSAESSLMEHAFSREGVPIERVEPYPDEGTRTRLHRQLARSWYVPHGVLGWFSVVDHKTIGKRYIITAFGFFIVGGILAALMRLQLAFPESRFLNPDQYNQIFTMHGTV